MSDAKKIVLYFKKSEPFKELYLNSNVINKWYGNVLKEIDSAGMIVSINKLGIDIYRKLINRELDESIGIHQIFKLIDEYFKQSFDGRTDSFYNVLVDYWMILTDIVQRNESIHSDKNVIVTLKDVKRILNHSLLIRLHLDKY